MKRLIYFHAWLKDFRRPWRGLSCVVLTCVVLQLMAVPSAAAAEGTAWDFLLRQRPAVAAGLSGDERRILEAVTEKQGEELLHGAGPTSRVLGSSLSKAGLRRAKKLLIAAFSASWWTVDSGAGTSTGGTFSITGTIGQADAGRLTGGESTLQGGFCAVFRNTYLFADGFESGDTTMWSSSVRSP